MLNSKIINISKLAEAAKIPYFRIYRRKSGETKKSLDVKDETKLFNALMREVKAYADDLGFEVNFNRKEDQN